MIRQDWYYDEFTEEVFLRYFSTYNARLAAAKKLCRMFVLPGDYILEIGCGVGIIAKSLAPLAGSYLGLDLSEKAIAVARQYVPTVSFYAGNILTFSLHTRFDAILLIDVVEHLSDLCTTFKKLEAHLSDRGRIIISCPTAGMINHLRKTGQKLQLIDNAISIRDILNVTALQPIYLSYFGVEYTNQYVQLVLGRELPVKPVSPGRVLNGMKSRCLRFKNRRMLKQST